MLRSEAPQMVPICSASANLQNSSLYLELAIERRPEIRDEFCSSRALPGPTPGERHLPWLTGDPLSLHHILGNC